MNLAHWANEARALIGDGPLPLIDDERLDLAGTLVDDWMELVDEDEPTPSELRHHDPNDRHERFAALNYLYRLSVMEFSGNEGADPGEVEDIRRPLRELLANHVALRRVEAIIDAGELEWELVNACAVAAWDRAEEIFDRLTVLSDAQRYEAWRGQVRVLSAGPSFTPPLQYWQFREASKTEIAMLCDTVTMVLMGTIPAKPLPPDAARRTAHGAVDLENARTRGEFPQYAFSLLGWAYAARGRGNGDPLAFVAAAREYEHVLDLQGRPEVFNSVFYSTIIDCYTEAGDTARAMEVAEKWSVAYPDLPKPYDRLGQLAARQGQFQRAFEAVMQARSKGASPGWTVDLLASVGNAYFSERWATRAMQDALDVHRDVGVLLATVVREYWPTYGRLNDDSKGRWLRALLLWQSPASLTLFASRFHAEVAFDFAVTLESEVRTKIFEPFRKHFNASPSAADHECHPKLSGYVRGENVTWGEMVNCLITQPKAPIGYAFERWLSNYQALKECFARMSRTRVRELIALRNRPAHGAVVTDDQVRQLHDTARHLLDLLYR